MSGKEDTNDLLAAAEWAAEIFILYGAKNPGIAESGEWMTRGMLAFLGLLDLRKNMQQGDAVHMTLSGCIDHGSKFIGRLIEEYETDSLIYTLDLDKP